METDESIENESTQAVESNINELDELIESENAEASNVNEPNEIEASTCSGDNDESDGCSEFDVGNWIGKTSSAAQKVVMLERCWSPHNSYDFRADAIDPKRVFKHDWLNTLRIYLGSSIRKN